MPQIKYDLKFCSEKNAKRANVMHKMVTARTALRNCQHDSYSKETLVNIVVVS